MPEKVYGICGTNKCRREVVSADNIKFLTGTTTELNETGNNKVWACVQFDYPDGFNPRNTIILGAFAYVLKGGGYGAGSYQLNGDSFLNYVKTNPTILIGFNNQPKDEFDNIHFKMKIDVVLTKANSDAT